MKTTVDLAVKYRSLDHTMG